MVTFGTVLRQRTKERTYVQAYRRQKLLDFFDDHLFRNLHNIMMNNFDINITIKNKCY